MARALHFDIPSTDDIDLMSDSATTRKGEIRAWVLDRISSGGLPSGSRIPSEHQLMSLFGVSRMTVHSALSELAREGVLRRVKGLGTFVARPGSHLTVVHVTDPAEEVRARGGLYDIELIKLEARDASEAERRIFGFTHDARLFHLKAVHKSGGVAAALEDRLVNPAVAPDFLEVDFRKTSAFAHLSGCAPLPEGSHVIRAVQPSPIDRALLKLEPYEPCLEIERTTWVEGAVVTRVTLRYPGSAYELLGAISRT